MNDFTKEELEKIRWCYVDSKFIDESLIKKIIFLVDNYCEHDWQDDPNNGFSWICMTCGEKIK